MLANVAVSPDASSHRLMVDAADDVAMGSSSGADRGLADNANGPNPNNLAFSVASDIMALSSCHPGAAGLG
jgi:hypothetical protein